MQITRKVLGHSCTMESSRFNKSENVPLEGVSSSRRTKRKKKKNKYQAFSITVRNEIKIEGD